MVKNSGKDLQSFYESFAGPKATSAKVAIPVLLFLSIGALFTETLVNDASRNELLEVASIALLVSIIYFLVFGGLIDRFTKCGSQAKALWLVILYFTTEMIRTLFIGWEVLQKNLAEEVQWDYRIVAGGLTGVVFFGVSSVVINDSNRYKIILNQLRIAQNDLRKSTAVTQDDLDKNKKRIIDSIHAAVNQALHSVINQPTADKENTKLVVNELVRVSEEVVRPLSHELFNDKPNFLDEITEPKQKTFSGFKIFKLATYAQPFHPTVTALFGLFQFLGLALFLTSNPVNGALTVIAFVFWIFIILFLAKKYVQPSLNKLNLVLRILVVNSIYVLMSSFLFLDPRLPDNLMLPHTTQLFIYLVVIGIIISWSLAVYSALNVAREETLNTFRETNEKLNWSNARLGAKLWAEQKKLAAMVHRDVQGALISTALKFRKDVESGVDPNLAADQIRDLISNTSAMVNSDAELSAPKTEIENLNNLWEGIFRISFEISDETYTKILNDPVCLQTVNDFIGEFATNSVKHGKASIGEIKIELIEENVLKIIMINNGLPLAENLIHGLGSQMVIRQSLSIVHENQPDGGVYFAATIPIS